MSKEVECSCCNGTGTYTSYADDEKEITCPRCGGTGVTYEDDEDDIAREREEERKYGKRFYQRGRLWDD